MKQTNSSIEKAQKLLKKVFGDKNGAIVSLKPIHLGYTNESFVATYENGQKYQVRLPHCGKMLNRSNEYKIIGLLKQTHDFPYFDVKTGNCIKKWIPGKCPFIPTFKKWSKVDDLFSQIKKFHNLKIDSNMKFAKLNFDSYNENLYRLDLVYQTKYLNIIEKYQDDVFVLNHTDINRENIIQDKNGKLHIIDFEWASFAPEYWDYANFIREARMLYSYIDWKKYIDNFDTEKLKNYIFATAVFAFLWSWQMPQTPKIKKYRKRTIRQIHWYGRKIIKNDSNK